MTGTSASDSPSAPADEVSIRLPAWFTSDGFLMTAEQLQNPSYILHGFLPELVAYFEQHPGALEVRVDNGLWHRVGGPVPDPVTLDGDARASWRPQLTMEELTSLPTEVHDVVPGSIQYGEALIDVIAREAPWRSWLEAATRAGYVAHTDGIELQVEALFRFARARLIDDDPHEWLDTRWYRRLMGLLAAEVQALNSLHEENFPGCICGQGGPQPPPEQPEDQSQCRTQPKQPGNTPVGGGEQPKSGEDA